MIPVPSHPENDSAIPELPHWCSCTHLSGASIFLYSNGYRAVLRTLAATPSLELRPYHTIVNEAFMTFVGPMLGLRSSRCLVHMLAIPIKQLLHDGTVTPPVPQTATAFEALRQFCLYYKNKPAHTAQPLWSRGLHAEA